MLLAANLSILHVNASAMKDMLALIAVVPRKIVDRVDLTPIHVNAIVVELIAAAMDVQTKIKNANAFATMVILVPIAVWSIQASCAHMSHAMPPVVFAKPTHADAHAIRALLEPIARAEPKIAIMVLWIPIRVSVSATMDGQVQIVMFPIPICYAQVLTARMVVRNYTITDNAVANARRVGQVSIVILPIQTFYAQVWIARMVELKVIVSVSVLVSVLKAGQVMIAVHLMLESCVPVVSVRMVAPKLMLMVNVDANVRPVGQVLIVRHRIRIFYVRACIVKITAPRPSLMANAHVNVPRVGLVMIAVLRMWVFYVHQRLATMVVLNPTIMVSAVANVLPDLREWTVLNEIARHNIAEPAAGTLTLVNVIASLDFREPRVQLRIRLLFALVLIVRMELKDTPGDNALARVKMVGPEPIVIRRIRPSYVDRHPACLAKAIKLIITAPVLANACRDGKELIVARKIAVPPAAWMEPLIIVANVSVHQAGRELIAILKIVVSSNVVLAIISFQLPIRV
jgi:hypothetical protein